jgi:hypothetical protein
VRHDRDLGADRFDALAEAVDQERERLAIERGDGTRPQMLRARPSSTAI